MRKFKALGLSLVAVLALSAMGASAAQADHPAHFTADPSAVKIDAFAASVQHFKTGLGTLTCNKVAGHSEASESAKTMTGTAVGYSECTAHTILGQKPTTVFPEEGCHFTFTAGTWTTTPEHADGIVHTCEVTIVIYDDAGHTEKRCELHTEPAAVPITFENVTTEGGVHAVLGTVKGAKVPTTRTDLNKLGCNNHVTEEPEYTGEVLFKATDENEEFVDATVGPTLE